MYVLFTIIPAKNEEKYQREKQKEEEKAFIRRIQKDIDIETIHSVIKS